MERQNVESSNLKSVGYSDGILEIEFHNGGVYRYYDVPGIVYHELMSADSLGSYFNYNIKLGDYEYRKIR